MARVLILGDNECGDLVKLIWQRKTSDQIEMTPDPEHVYAICQTNPPDLVIMSWTSTYSGVWYPEFRDKLRTQPNGAAMPLILVSAHYTKEFLDKIKDEPTIFILAPMHPDEIIEARNRLLGSAL